MIRTTLCTLLLTSLALASLDKAKTNFAAGEFKAALAAAGEIAPRDADYARAQYLMGEIHLLLGDPETAAKSFRAALETKPDAEPILTGLGRALLDQDFADEAVPVLEKAVKANPASGRALCFLGIARMKDSGGDKGKKQVEKGAKLAKGDPEVARAVVLSYLDDTNTRAATRAAQRFAKARSSHPMGPFLKALVLENDKQFKDAIEQYQKSIKLDENFIDAHKNLAILCIAQNPLYRDQKRTTLAMHHFERYFTLGGKDPELKRVHETLKSFLKTR